MPCTAEMDTAWVWLIEGGGSRAHVSGRSARQPPQGAALVSGTAIADAFVTDATTSMVGREA